MKLITLVLGMVVIAVAVMAAAQAPALKPAFEVASIKKATARFYSVSAEDGRLVAKNTPLRVIIQRAYAPSNGRPLLRSQIVGGPAWINTDGFDIEAKAGSDSRPPQDELWLMARTLLEDRFQLKWHHEMRDLPLYNLIVAKSGKLKLSEDQSPVDPAAPKILDPSHPPRGAFRNVGKPSPTAITVVMTGSAVRMDAFMNVLQQYVDRPLVDKSGLTGLYDVELQFEIAAGNPQGNVAGAPVASEPGIASIFTALQEQLGLKLESSKGLVEVLVIDSVSRPTEN
jgi:uncharacterized protein (TIGR03435 family)